MPRLVVDTGFLVALYRRRDGLHADAVSFLRENRAPLVTVSAVIAEACYFLSAPAKSELLKWAARGGIAVAEVPVDAYPVLAMSLTRYANLDLDFTDVALVWLADLIGERAILSVDDRDFAVIRLKGKKRFELVPWHG
ncbi:MAG: type II toxin-antitoxin system VapC family toxin [Burkholderiales bacterium]